MKKKYTPRKFQNMGYRQVQKLNSKNRQKLDYNRRKWLRSNGYKNIGWSNVISLYYKIEEFVNESKFDDFCLEELFLEADRIGNKYLSEREINEFNVKLSREVNQVAEVIDRQFPDTEIEIIDFSSNRRVKYRQRNSRKIYR